MSRRCPIARASLAVAALALMLPPTVASAREAWPAEVKARYKLKFQGIDVGKVDITSKTTGDSYTMSGGAQLSLLLGVFKVKTSGQAAGGIAAEAPAPKSYAFDWQGGKKKGAIRMGFDGGAAKTVSVDPPPGADEDRVPLLDKHKADVVDPISAIMSLTRADAKPCEKKVAVFDGKHRFDIALAFKRKITIESKAKGGNPATGIVCRITYVPIAGHKMKAETAHIAANKDMELILRTLPGSDMTIPHAVYIPTSWGTASMVIERVDVTTRSIGQIALTD